MQGINTGSSIPTLYANNVSHDTNKEKSDLFASQFSDTSSKSNHTKAFQRSSEYLEKKWKKQDQKASNTTHQLDTPFAYHELNTAIKQSKRGSTPGADHITYEMLQHLPRKCISMILLLYNELWKQGKLIQDWSGNTR